MVGKPEATVSILLPDWHMKAIALRILDYIRGWEIANWQAGFQSPAEGLPKGRPANRGDDRRSRESRLEPGPRTRDVSACQRCLTVKHCTPYFFTCIN